MSTLTMMKSATDTICLSLVFECEEGAIVFDGGFESESEVLFEKLRSLGGKVAGWFFTHPHDDHVGAFCRIMQDHADEISVKALYYNFPPAELLNQYEPHEKKSTDLYMPLIPELCEKNGINIVTMHRGDVYDFKNACIRVLREPRGDITRNYINNSSVVLRLDVNDKSVLLLGDLGVEGGEDLLHVASAQELKCDYVQMAHHGQNGVTRAVYEAIDPDYCLWCTPTWLWDNMGPEGYDSGIFKTVVVRGWMSEIGIKKHYVNMNGPHCIEL